MTRFIRNRLARTISAKQAAPSPGAKIRSGQGRYQQLGTSSRISTLNARRMINRSLSSTK